MAGLTRSKRTVVIRNALTVYHWYVRQALTGNQVIARKPTGEEVTFEAAELAILEGKSNKLSPEELGLLAKDLSTARDTPEAGHVRERLTRCFYGVLGGLDGKPEVPENQWYKRCSRMTVCGEEG
jgi:hypothetical protein